jgi:hypothetical protein
MTTHRLIQVHVLFDTLSSRARVCRRAADNLARIGNDRGAAHYLRRASRLERIASACAQRLCDA